MSGLTIYKGQTWKRRLAVVNQVTGAPYDLTGATIEFIGKHRTSDASRLIDLSIGVGITVLAQTGSTLGMADVELDGSVSAGFQVDSVIAAAKVVIPGDDDVKVPFGPVRIQVVELP